MTQLAVGYRTVVDSGREHRSDGLLKHLGVADVGTLRATNNLTQTLHAGKGVEMCLVPGQYGLIQCLDRDVGPPSAWIDLVIAGQNITLQPHGGSVNLPYASVSETWETRADGSRYPMSVSAWTAYDVPGVTPITFTLRQTARVRMDWVCTYTPATPSTTYFKGNLDGSEDLDVLDTQGVAGWVSTAVGWAVFYNKAPGVHTAKMTFTPTAGGTWAREAWYTRLLVTADYA